MNRDDNLDTFLSRLSPPDPSPEAVSMARQKARLALKHRHQVKAAPEKDWITPLWRYSGVFAAMAVLWVIFYPQNELGDGFSTPWTEVLQEQRAMYRELHQVFPGEFQGVVAKNGDSELILGTHAPSDEQAIVLQLKHNNQIIQALTFSGQIVELGLAGERFRLEVLALPDGRLAIISDGDGAVELDVRNAAYQVYKPRAGFVLRAGYLNKPASHGNTPQAKAKVAL